MVKCLVGYDIVPGVTPEEYDAWLWDIHTPDLMANPYIDKIVYNTVLRPIVTASGDTMKLPESLKLYRVAEMHFQDEEAYDKYRAWFIENPIPAERGPAGRSDFKFYLLCTVSEGSRDEAGNLVRR